VLLFYDATTPEVVGPVLEKGATYSYTVTGEWSAWRVCRDKRGTYWPCGSAFCETGCTDWFGFDADVKYSWPPYLNETAGHSDLFQVNRGGVWYHNEAEGGPYATPQGEYHYTITGTGAEVRFRVADSPWTNNAGGFTIHLTGPT
jgi:hypothetical protein